MVNAMRILVISDTHRSLNRAIELVHEFSKRIDAVIHLGDNTEDVDFIRRNYRLPVYVVAGNCDYGSTAPHESVVEFEGKKVFFTHGHYYNVKYNADAVTKRALELGADLCLFGHTHAPHLQLGGDVIVMNPGSLSEPRGGSKPSYGIVKIENDRIIPMVIPYI